MVRRPLLALLLLPSAFGCSCETEATDIQPAIGLWTESLDPQTPGEPGERLTAPVDFDQVPTRSTETRTLVVRSESLSPLGVKSFSFADDDGKSAAMFRVVEPEAPLQIPSSGHQLVTVEFAPKDPVTYNARLVVASDDPEKPTISAALTGEGTEGDVQVWACKDTENCETVVNAPGPYDIGPVYQGDQGSALVVIFNRGLDRLLVSSVTFEDPMAAADAGFGLEGAGMLNVPKRSSRSVTVTFKPKIGAEPGPASATLVVKSEDRDEPELKMQITATSLPNHPPEACIFVKSIQRFVPEGGGPVETFMPGDPIPIVEPLDVVTIATDVRAGCTGDPDGDHGARLTRLWKVQGPEPTTVDMGPVEYTFTTQISGAYTISLQVTDPLGLVATADGAGVPATVALDVRPVADIAVEVRWDEAVDPAGVGGRLVDVDAHLMRGGPTTNLIADLNDCAQKCERKNWGLSADPEDNPRQLGMDDNGFGNLTETILLDRPENGQIYLAGAHYFADQRQVSEPVCASDDQCLSPASVCIAGTCRTPVWVRVKVFIKGVETPIPGAPEGRVKLSRPCDFWYAAQITWDGKNDTGIVTGVGTSTIPDYGGTSGGGNTCPLD